MHGYGACAQMRSLHNPREEAKAVHNTDILKHALNRGLHQSSHIKNTSCLSSGPGSQQL